ncbi:DNA-binding response regulator [Bacteroidota bacterium]|nr:DNA-binding response regulator [Bacteroidota bacterium]
MKCLVVDDDKISRELMCECINETEDLVLSNVCKSAIEASNYLAKNEVDLIFLDVEMPKMSGLELLKSLNHKPQVILVTAKEKYAVEAFEYEVTDYLVKPVNHTRFLKAIQKVRTKSAPSKIESVKGGNIFIKVDSELINLPTTDILWIEALGDYVNFITAAKKYVVLSTMKNIEAKLPSKEFVRVHRSYLVRIDKIKKISEDILLVENKLIPVSKSYKKELLDRLITL